NARRGRCRSGPRRLPPPGSPARLRLMAIRRSPRRGLSGTSTCPRPSFARAGAPGGLPGAGRELPRRPGGLLVPLRLRDQGVRILEAFHVGALDSLPREKTRSQQYEQDAGEDAGTRPGVSPGEVDEDYDDADDEVE